MAFWEAARGGIGSATAGTLLATSVLVALGTRRGDLPLALVYPPLAFLASVLLAGQQLVARGAHWKTQQALMLYDTLGRNARAVIGATIIAAALVGLRTLVGWLLARRRAR